LPNLRRKSPKVSGRFRRYSRFGETIGGDRFDHDCRPTMALCAGQFSGTHRTELGICLLDCRATAQVFRGHEAPAQTRPIAADPYLWSFPSVARPSLNLAHRSRRAPLRGFTRTVLASLRESRLRLRPEVANQQRRLPLGHTRLVFYTLKSRERLQHCMNIHILKCGGTI
jgi:hypothetical protein